MISEARLNRIWYGGERPALWMRLLAPVFRMIVFLRRALYRARLLPSRRFPVPVIVVGNLTVGGTGKTPLVIYLVEHLLHEGYRPGVVSRGYGSRTGTAPVRVGNATSPEDAGDEPVLIAHRTGVPVFVHRKRVHAIEALLEAQPVDVVICDDGLQHYALARDIEIAVIDGTRGLGNGRMLPTGPLREPLERLAGVDHLVVNGSSKVGLTVPAVQMQLRASALVNLATGERRSPAELSTVRCVAIAGIGNPQRFFALLGELGFDAECRAFRDHHLFSEEDLAFARGRTLIMTEKDAVKCKSFARPDWWYLEVSADLGKDLAARILASLALPRRREENP